MTNPLERELLLADQAAKRGVARRRAAIVAANATGPDGKPLMTIYRIAQVLGVKESAIRSVLSTAGALKSAEKEEKP